jgi:uncharacterized coiled-coil protein SlyX
MPSRLVSPTIARGDEESDSDATCVATETESLAVKAGIAGNAREHSNFLVPQRKSPRASKRRLPGIPSSDTAQASKIIDAVQPLGYSPSFDLGAVVRKDEHEGCNWQEQAGKLSAQLSQAKAESGRLIFGLRQQLEVAEKSLRRERHEVWTLRAEVGMKDLYVHSLCEARRQGQVVLSAMQERIARAEAMITQLGGRLAEKEVEATLKDLHIRSLMKRIEQSESRFASMEAALEQKDAELTRIGDALVEQEAIGRARNECQETVSSLKDIVAEKDADIAQLRARLVQEESESRQRERKIRSLSEASQRLGGLCSSLEQTVTKNDSTIKDLNHRLSEAMTEVRMKESRIQALSDARRYPPGSAKAEIQKTISQYEHQIADLKDRVAACNACLSLEVEAPVPGKRPQAYLSYWNSYSREGDSGMDPSTTTYETA